MIRAVALFLFLLSGSPRVAVAQPAPMWNDDWPKFRSWEYAAMGVMIGGIAVFSSTDPVPKERWTGTLPGDTWVRGGLVARTRKGRTAAAHTSDLFLYTLV
ncbi:MAG: hypothetical protein JRJ84_15415, partial [Deltaproteobacteria bacterium]|nr:hypothetical protein [Deltaproteobacteria bacterium]